MAAGEEVEERRHRGFQLDDEGVASFASMLSMALQLSARKKRPAFGLWAFSWRSMLYLTSPASARVPPPPDAPAGTPACRGVRAAGRLDHVGQLVWLLRHAIAEVGCERAGAFVVVPQQPAEDGRVHVGDWAHLREMRVERIGDHGVEVVGAEDAAA